MNRVHRKVTILIIILLFSNISFADNLFQAKVNADILNIRSKPSIESEKSGQLRNSQMVYIEMGSEFSMLLDGRGYVSNDFLDIGNQLTEVEITTDTDVFGLPDENSRVLASVKKGEKLYVSRYFDGFLQVSIGEVLGFVSLEKTALFETNTEKFNLENDELLKKFKTHLGKDYHWGHEGPNSFDCSGFTLFIYKEYYGYKLPHSSSSMSKLGTYVEKENLKFGDLVFFTTDRSGNVNHVGVYIGNGEFIHASSAKDKVMISPLNKGFYDEVYKWGKRFFWFFLDKL